MSTKKTKSKIALGGSWRAVYSELNGQMTPVKHFSTIVITFRSGKFQIESDGEIKHEGTFELDESTNPAKITYTYTKSDFFEKNKPRKGIIQVNKNTMKDCLGAIGTPAPRNFNTTPETDSVLTIHQKVGKEGGTGIQSSRVKNISEW